ncbi:MAG: DUF2203 family protein [Planctomycetota bacterium]
MDHRYTLEEANRLLPLVSAIAAEITDRRDEKRQLRRVRSELEHAKTDEGLKVAISDIDSRIFELEMGMNSSQKELEALGLHILRSFPLTIHIPGHSQPGPLVFCWQEGESRVCHGHAVGEEEDPRRPLRVRAPSSGKAS